MNPIRIAFRIMGRIFGFLKRFLVKGAILALLIAIAGELYGMAKRDAAAPLADAKAYADGKDPITGDVIIPYVPEADNTPDTDVNTPADNDNGNESVIEVTSEAPKIRGIVKEVIDGDTLWVNIPEENEITSVKVRLIGVDTPESVHVDDSRNVPEGKIASDFTKSLLLPGFEVFLELDVDPEDDYGRTLAYVWFEGYLVQDILLAEGMARTMTIAPNVAYAKHFVEVQREAEQNGRGFWKDYFLESASNN